MTLTTTSPAPVETVTPIKASEAIRLGCLIAPEQAFGKTHDGPRACAIGAMELGIYGRRFTVVSDHFVALRGSLPTDCPVDPTHQWERDGWSNEAGPTSIAHLNDDHRWSRERIADWLESLGL